jgi:hypothetical protein
MHWQARCGDGRFGHGSDLLISIIAGAIATMFVIDPVLGFLSFLRFFILITFSIFAPFGAGLFQMFLR